MLNQTTTCFLVAPCELGPLTPPGQQDRRWLLCSQSPLREAARSWGSPPPAALGGEGIDYTWRRSQTFLPGLIGMCPCQCWALMGTEHHLLHGQPSAQRGHPQPWVPGGLTPSFCRSANFLQIITLSPHWATHAASPPGLSPFALQPCPGGSELLCWV